MDEEGLIEYEKHIKIIEEVVHTLCEGLEKYYPGITNKEYSMGDDIRTFKERMLMVIHHEVYMAGILKKFW